METIRITHVFLMLFGVVAIVLADCPAGYESHGDFCYTVLRVNATWAESQEYCKALGGQLAVIPDQTESDFVTAMLNKKHASIHSPQIWLGGTDLLQEGTWLAPGTLETLAFFNWGPGEPDNSNVDQHCLAIFNSPPTFKWDDSWCDHKMNPLCQMPSSGMTDVIG